MIYFLSCVYFSRLPVGGYLRHEVRINSRGFSGVTLLITCHLRETLSL